MKFMRIACSAGLTLLFLSILPPLSAQDADPGTIAVFDLGKSITDQPTPDDPLFGTIGSESLHSLLTRLHTAGNDEEVAAIVLLLGNSGVDMNHLEELHQTLLEIREKKPIYAHADAVTTGSYALMTAASRLSISPTGDVFINGLYGEQVFLRGLLDMLHVEPVFLTCGDYKSAAEMFTRKEPSPEAAEMTKWLYDGLFTGLKNRIAEGRKVEQAKVTEWIDRGLYNAESALDANLIEAVETREQLTAMVKSKHGNEVNLDRKYGKKSGPDIDLNNPFAALQLWAQIVAGPQVRRSTEDAIAVVHIDGSITLGSSEASFLGSVEGAYSEVIRKAVDQVADDPRVKGIVVRVNSPGGSATASEIMLQSILRAQAKKPVVVSMGGVAASGGYYVACRADRIFATEATITGSIGVVAGKLATEQMWNMIGVNFKPIQRGERAGILQSSRPFTDEEREELQKWMNDVYEVFKKHVTTGRGDKLAKPIDELAGGRVYSGQQALELGLIDEIGTLEDAIDYMAEETNLNIYEIRTVPKVENFLESLFAEMSPNKKEDDKQLSTQAWSQLQPVLQQLDPIRTEMVREALLQLDGLQRERIMLTAPIIRVW